MREWDSECGSQSTLSILKTNSIQYIEIMNMKLTCI